MRKAPTLFLRAIISGVIALLPVSASADINWNRIDLSRERAAIETFQGFDQRMQDVGWKLVRSWKSSNGNTSWRHPMKSSTKKTSHSSEAAGPAPPSLISIPVTVQ